MEKRHEILIQFTLISVLSLLYMRYYEKILYFKPINQFLDIAYWYIAIPSFYYFLIARITIINGFTSIYSIIFAVLGCSFVLSIKN